MKIFFDDTEEKIKSLEAEIEVLKYDMKTLQLQLKESLDYQQRALNEMYTKLGPLPEKIESLDRRMIDVTRTVFYDKQRRMRSEDEVENV